MKNYQMKTIKTIISNELKTLMNKEFGEEIPIKVAKEENSPLTQPLYNITFEKPLKGVKYVVLQEDISEGQRVESFRITADFTSGAQYPIYQGTCIGNKKICQLQNPFVEQNPLLDDTEDTISGIQVKITAARDEVFIKKIKIY